LKGGIEKVRFKNNITFRAHRPEDVEELLNRPENARARYSPAILPLCR
jgi:hypothetical protein